MSGDSSVTERKWGLLSSAGDLHISSLSTQHEVWAQFLRAAVKADAKTIDYLVAATGQ